MRDVGLENKITVEANNRDSIPVKIAMENKNIPIPAHFVDALEDVSLTPDERIKRIYQHQGWTNSIDDRLTYKEFSMPADAEDSLDQLVEWYVNKKSKRVKYAGSKLRKAFLTLPPVEQRKVGLALLTGGKTDTEWVCARLLGLQASMEQGMGYQLASLLCRSGGDSMEKAQE